VLVPLKLLLFLFLWGDELILI